MGCLMAKEEKSRRAVETQDIVEVARCEMVVRFASLHFVGTPPRPIVAMVVRG